MGSLLHLRSHRLQSVTGLNVKIFYRLWPVFLFFACGESAAMSPEKTIGTYARALRAGETEQAYSMMSRSFRDRVSFEEFKTMLGDDRAEIEETVELLLSLRAPASQEAIVRYGNGDELRLIFENGEWKVATNVVDYYSQATPRDAIRSFVRAVERRRYDVLLQLAPRSEQEWLSREVLEQNFEGEARAELERIVAALRESLDKPIQVTADRATMEYAERFTIRLVRQDGLWRIEDPD